MNDRNFSGYDGPCVCCQPKPTEKTAKAYARGVKDERNRILTILNTWVYDDYGDFDSYLEQIKEEKK